MASLESIEVDKYCHPFTILWTGNRDSGCEGAVGDNLNDKWPESNPPLELNLARIWRMSKGFKNFARRFIIVWSEEYLHTEVRCECTNPPAGRGGLPLEYKQSKEEWYMHNLIKILYGKYGTQLCREIPDSLAPMARRVVRDIDRIRSNGWVDKISDESFYHGHAGLSFQYIGHDPFSDEDVVKLMEDPNLRILYHARQKQNGYAENTNINIISSPSGQLDVVKSRTGKTVNCMDLGMRYLFDVRFEPDRQGKYQLQDGTNVWIYTWF